MSNYKKLTCTDIDEATLAENAGRLSFIENLIFTYFDFRLQAFEQKFDSAYAVDVLEHIYPSEEAAVLTNITGSLKPHGTALFGTPNLSAEKYASKLSKLGHVNLKDAASLRLLMQQHFHSVFMFSMNDEVVHTGYAPMAHYLWALCVGPKST